MKYDNEKYDNEKQLKLLESGRKRIELIVQTFHPRPSVTDEVSIQTKSQSRRSNKTREWTWSMKDNAKDNATR